jgi:hypothetical protein
METKESAKGILEASAQTPPLLAKDAEFAKVGQRARSLAENGFSLAGPEGDGISRQEQIKSNAPVECDNLAECI